MNTKGGTVVQQSLVELFQYVADAFDGETEPHHIEGLRAAYKRLMEKPQMQRFYGQLVDDNERENFDRFMNEIDSDPISGNSGGNVE